MLPLDLNGASFALVTNTTTTLVTAISNTNGIIVYQGNVAVANGGNGRILSGSNEILRGWGVTGQAVSAVLANPILLPAGVTLVLTSDSTQVICSCAYKVL